MRRLVVLVVSFAIATVAACTGQDANPTVPSNTVATPGDLAAKPPPATTLIPAMITFSNRPGDAITSDGGGTYVRGGRLEVGFYTLSEDLVMRGGGRTVVFSHPDLGTTQDLFVNIHGILNMGKGTSRSNGTAAFRRTSTNFLRFNPDNYAGTSFVTVSRDTAGVWTVTANNPNALAAHVRNNNVLGIYAMPFQLTAQCVTATECP
jgi:hypothetical protein